MHKALLVDDNPRVREGLVAVLEQHGWQVVQATEPTEALDLLESEEHQAEPFDLMVLDHDLGGLGTGFDVLEDWSGLPTKPPVVLVLTGNLDPGLEHRYLRAGATAFLRKPVEGDRLMAVVVASLAEVAGRRG